MDVDKITSSAALLSSLRLGHLREQTPFALAINVLHLTYFNKPKEAVSKFRILIQPHFIFADFIYQLRLYLLHLQSLRWQNPAQLLLFLPHQDLWSKYNL